MPSSNFRPTTLDAFPSPLALQGTWWFDAYTNPDLLTERAHATRVAYAYGHRLRRFVDSKNTVQVWHCHDDGIWRLDPEALQTTITQHLPELLLREAREHLARGDGGTATSLIDVARTASGRTRFVSSISQIIKNFAEPFLVTQLAAHHQQIYVTGSADEYFSVHDDPTQVAYLDALVALSPDGPTDLGPPQPHHYLRATTGHLRSSTDPQRPIPMFTTDLLERFIPDPEVRDFISLKLGTNLLGRDTKDSQLIQLYGHGANGKSTLTKVSIQAIGEYGAEVDARFFASAPGRNESEHRTYMPAVVGKRAATNAEELPANALLNEEVMKAVTEGEQVTFRRMYGNEERIYSNVTPWVATNHPIGFKGQGDTRAAQRRLYVIEMPNTLQDHETDPDFKNRLLRLHAADICRWHEEQAIRYLKATQRGTRVLIAPKTVQRQTEAHLLREIPLGFFIRDCLTESSTETPVTQIYEAYLAWRVPHGGEDEAGLPTFTQEAMLRHIPKDRFPVGRRPVIRSTDTNEAVRLSTRRCAVIHPDAISPIPEDVFTDEQRRGVQEYINLALLKWDELAELYYTDLDTQEAARREEERELWTRAVQHFTQTGRVPTVHDHFNPEE